MRRAISFAGLLLLFAPAALAINGPKAAQSNVERSARHAVQALNQKEEEACSRMDNWESGELWADDGVDLIEGLKPMVGKAAILKWYDSLTTLMRGAKMEYCTVDWRKIKIQGEWAWEWAITRQKIDLPAPQKPIESNGKMLLILKRQADGEWKIELESWNSEPK